METPSSPLDAIAKEEIIGRATPVEDIISALAKRGCQDLTSSIDLAACKENPYAFGGFCDVFQGVLRDNTRIAIKRLRVCDGPGMESDSENRKILKRAARELYHWSKLRHRNIMPLIGLAIFRGHMSMISQWMDNGNLSAFIRLNSNADRNKLCMDVCEGLYYIHANNMVHGDLKAANVMVSSDGTAMIADFGNAQLKDFTLKFTHTKTSGLSVRWAAPELLLQDDCPQMSKEADVYAYGMTALEALTGKVPYEGISDNRVMMLVAYERKVPPRPETNISDELWRMLNLCWARERSERPEIAGVKNLLQAQFLSSCPAEGRYLPPLSSPDITSQLPSSLVSPSTSSKSSDTVPALPTSGFNLTNTHPSFPPQPPSESSTPNGGGPTGAPVYPYAHAYSPTQVLSPVFPQPSGRSFGVPLEVLLARDGGEQPKVLSKCAEAIEKRGLDIVGVYSYKLSRTASRARELRGLLDRDLDAVDLDSDEWATDINNVASVLKLWLRELPEPLMTWELYNSFINAARHPWSPI